ncbi:MAG: hypothetical protein AABY84_13060 [Candidatus Firestonebacteria bacterium]
MFDNKLKEIFKKVIREQYDNLRVERDIIIWFCHYLIEEFKERVKWQSEKENYDLYLKIDDNVEYYCEFKYFWEGGIYVKKDVEKLTKKKDVAKVCFFAFYNIKFRDTWAVENKIKDMEKKGIIVEMIAADSFRI